MNTRTLTWALLAMVLALALTLSSGMLSRAAADPPARLAPAQGTTPAQPSILGAPLFRVHLPLILNGSVQQEPYDLQDHWLRSLVVAPGESGKLYGVTNEGYLLTSFDRGGVWQAMSLPIAGDGAPSLASAVGMDYNHPETLYLSTSAGIWHSTDGGTNWEKRSAGYFGAVTVDLDASNVLWSGNPAPARSTDGGATWWPANEGFNGSLLSPVVIDPQAHDLRYAVSQNKGGGGDLYRRTDANMWDKVDGAPVGG